jgi:hypothetical protein
MEIDYEGDWAGEQRTDPSDGNAFVLREIAPNGFGFSVRINDIMGGHSRWLSASEWCTWELL